eukprot:TRINITY_DN10933_c0_g2_i1.p2 TRINITY_DN10933_c0_g2~~TRINITY_DN10933_c0_g2_i1.p2  ORF type:complete len:335 (-),score=70.13 TRINITY_DN10933_c0_g2_i1:96-1049(-)
MSRSLPMRLAALCVALGATLGDAATASGCPERFPNSEDERRQIFRKIYGKWPPKISLPGKKPMKETPEWAAYHRNKEAGLMELTNPTHRWEFWLEQAQIRTLKNFTATGWAMGKMPGKVHKRVQEFFRERLTTDSKNHSVPLYTTGDQTMVHLDYELSNEVTEAVRRKIGKWANVPASDLEPTSTYGIRNYWKGSTLKTHVDRVETHILSAVYCVDSKYNDGEEAWPIETDPDLTGVHVKQEVKPGELFFYESAKLAHGRPSALQGDYSAHIFIHFRPKDWPFHNMDRVYGVPPGYADDETPSTLASDTKLPRRSEL